MVYSCIFCKFPPSSALAFARIMSWNTHPLLYMLIPNKQTQLDVDLFIWVVMTVSNCLTFVSLTGAGIVTNDLFVLNEYFLRFLHHRPRPGKTSQSFDVAIWMPSIVQRLSPIHHYLLVPNIHHIACQHDMICS